MRSLSAAKGSLWIVSGLLGFLSGLIPWGFFAAFALGMILVVVPIFRSGRFIRKRTRLLTFEIPSDEELADAFIWGCAFGALWIGFFIAGFLTGNVTLGTVENL